MSELKITKERVLTAAEKCEDAKEVLQELFPDVFKGQWKDITEEIEWKIVKDNATSVSKKNMHHLVGFHTDDDLVVYVSAGSMFLLDGKRYKINTDRWNNFCILKKMY